MARGDLTDDEWPLIDSHLPLGERGPIPDPRRQFNAGLAFRFDETPESYLAGLRLRGASLWIRSLQPV